MGNVRGREKGAWGKGEGQGERSMVKGRGEVLQGGVFVERKLFFV